MNDEKMTEDDFKVEEENNDSYTSYETSSDGDNSENDGKKKMLKYVFWGAIGFFAFLLILVVLVSSRSSNTDTDNETEEKNVKMAAGDKITLEYQSESFSWNGTNNSVAVITEDGQIEALKEGDTVITIKVDDATYIVNVHVEGTAYTVTSIELNKEVIELKVDDIYSLKTIINPPEAKDTELTWHSSNEKVAKVDNKGTVTALAVGTSTITVKTGNGNTAICIVKVTAIEDEDDDFDKIVFDVNSIVLKDGIKYTIDYSIEPKDANVKLIWESSDTKVATVEDGIIQTLAPGTTTITAKKANKEAIVYVTVVKGDSSTPDVIDDGKEIKAVSINMNQTELNMKVSQDYKLTAEVLPSNTTNKAVTYKSTNTEVATVDETGKVVAVAKGTATITATTANGIVAEVKVTVDEEKAKEIESITLSIKNVSLSPGNTIQLVETYSPSDAAVEKLTWTSSDNNVATVEDGLVTAMRNGTATITVSSDSGIKATCNITVNSSVVTVTTVNINPSSVSIRVNGTTQLSAEFYPPYASNKTLTWRSSNKSIATVDGNGLVTGKKAGQATIFATSSNGVVGVATVIVN